MSEVIRADKLGKTYAEGKLHTPVFDGLDFIAHAGETVAILGASGAGKSTLLHLLGGLDVPSAGEVYVAGQKMSALSDAARGRLRNRALGFIYQFHHLLPEFTALENVMMPMLVEEGFPSPDIERRAADLLDRVGLTKVANNLASNMSGGQQQRVAVARALAMNPDLVLADEPTGNLDSHSADGVFELMRQVNRQNGTTFLIVTHNLELARRCDGIIQLVDGVIAN